jgi:hypothetical protein
VRAKGGRIPTHVYFPPKLAAAVYERAEQLELSAGAYLSILLRNAVYARSPSSIEMPEEDRRARHVREPVPISVKRTLYVDAAALAERLGGTFSRLAEALARAELRAPQAQLTVWPKPGVAKPVWKA